MTRYLGTPILLAALLLAGCAPERQHPGPAVEAPHIDGDVFITADVSGDLLDRRIVLYLTALHEIGHALGLPHNNDFGSIMYAFRFPGDGERYFGAYRNRLRSADDIGRRTASGLSEADVETLKKLYSN